jgi:hypothetical protein
MDFLIFSCTYISYTAVAGGQQSAENSVVNLTNPDQPALTGKKRASGQLAN